MATVGMIDNKDTTILELACARNAAVEIRYEPTGGERLSCRTRMIELASDRILLDAPRYPDRTRRIPVGVSVDVLVTVVARRYRFESVIIDDRTIIRLNDRQRVRGIALVIPDRVVEDQRRDHFRIAVSGRDPIGVRLVECHPDMRDACLVGASIVDGRMANISAGGISAVFAPGTFAARDCDRFFFATSRCPVWMLRS